MDVDQRKKVFGEQLLANIPLAAHIKRVLDERPSHRAPATRFREELEDFMSEDYAERTLRAIINLGRYGELFAYDEDAQAFSYENPHLSAARTPRLRQGFGRKYRLVSRGADPLALLQRTMSAPCSRQGLKERPMATTPATLTVRRQDSRAARQGPARSARRSSTSASSTPRPACSPSIPASPRRRAPNRRSPTSTATRACCSIAATRSTSSPSTATFSRPAISCSTANCRPPRRRPISTTASRATRWCTSRWRGSSRASAATRIRCR